MATTFPPVDGVRIFGPDDRSEDAKKAFMRFLDLMHNSEIDEYRKERKKRLIQAKSKLPFPTKRQRRKKFRTEDAEDEEDVMHDDACSRCGGTGELLMCDRCPRVYHHQTCLNPPLKDVPDGDWVCPMCSTLAERAKDKPEAAPKSLAELDDEDYRFDFEQVELLWLEHQQRMQDELKRRKAYHIELQEKNKQLLLESEQLSHQIKVSSSTLESLTSENSENEDRIAALRDAIAELKQLAASAPQSMVE